MNKKYNLKLDLQFRCNNSTMKFNQFDNNTSDFFIKISSGGKSFDVEKAIVVLATIKPSGKVASQFVEIENGLVYADLKPNMVDEIGIYTAQAMLILEDERVVTDVISYEVEEDKIFSLLNDTVGTSEEFTLLTDMLSRLSTIEISEEQRVINEAERILSEENRKIEEANRVEAELIRVHEEADRTKYDAIRESNENIRKLNEQTRVLAENTRLENEANRIEQEANRVKAEQLRKDNYNLMTEDEERRRSEANAHKEAEVLRVQAETNRVNEEAKRRTTEQARVSAENTRVSNENTRKANETTRQTNETHRVEAETQRQNRYNSFILEAEANANNFENYTNNAKIKEEERKSNELNRKSQEDRRVSNEVERISNENTRKANENARIESEKQRVDAENLRKEKIVEIQSDYDSLKKVIIDENASANLQNQINQTNSQLEHIETEVNKPITLNKCDEEMLGAIQNKEGETSFNLLSIPREKSVDHSKVKDTDFYTVDVDWSTLNRKSDGAGNWLSNVLYKKGFVKNVTIEVDSENDETGKIFIYKVFDDGSIQLAKSYDVNGKGKISINIDSYIEHDFYISTKIANVKYTSSETIKTSSIGESTDRFTPNFSFKYCFAVGVNYHNIYKAQEKLLFNDNMQRLKSGLVLPMANGVTYPIIFDFIAKQLTIGNMYIVDTSNSFNGKVRYPLKNTTMVINDLPLEKHYVIYLMFNLETKEFELLYSNGESLILDMSSFDNKLLICYGLTDGQTYFTFGDINSNYVKAIVKYERNVDDTLEDDKIIPKYAEKKIITSLLQKNRWFNKKANIIGDSVIKGENSADSYKRMKDDNVASILMEEFGFREVRNYGIGGSRITTHSDSTFTRKGMVDRYVDMSNDADLNIVSGGTNDFGNSIPLGSLNDLSDNTKFKPALYNLLSGMQEKYPGKELYFIIPTHRKDSKPDNVANSAGLTLKDYVDACYEVCELLSVEIIDMWKELGFSPHVSTLRNTFMPDGLHPSIRGMREYYGAKICKTIK